jgi:hypothetical protein
MFGLTKYYNKDSNQDLILINKIQPNQCYPYNKIKRLPSVKNINQQN